MTLLERIAQAMYEAERALWDSGGELDSSPMQPWDSADDGDKDEFLRHANAAMAIVAGAFEEYRSPKAGSTP